ncbi:zinc ribbon domain-containing protein [Nocardioides sp. Soil796]|uniref:zinc ribbon domain-containing protein n=1 Tax=Nocardioides sp. Soil796 TaxID=1736412 RepID=UPI000710F559|nr:zinc ribbon domain-containing protein [Nocardioides sp. Soil796]KRF13096.1 hypothetical protein ASH02_16580 [Nocardioides sp. Soil796]
MFRYADPEACPACRAPIPSGCLQCPQCDTQLTGTIAQRLFRTLTHADSLVAELAALSANSTAARTAAYAPLGPDPVGVGALLSAPAAAPAGSMLPPDLPTFPSAIPGLPGRRQPGTGLSGSSVPKILLGLGATCLLVAALVFLAVAWSALGVGGRTGVLVLLTATAGALTWLMARKSLSAGAEAFMALALGLLTLDVFGARSAGWLGDLGSQGFTLVLGVVLAAAGLGGALALRRSPVGALITGQVVGALGVGLVVSGLPEVNPDVNALQATVSLVAVGALAHVVHRLHLQIAAILLAVGASMIWVSLALLGLSRLDFTPTFAEVWGGLAIWPTLVAAAIAAAPVVRHPAIVRIPVAMRVLSLGVAVALFSLVVTLPSFDESATLVSLVELAMVAAACAGSFVVARPWRAALAAPPVVAAAGLLGAVSVLVGTALNALLSVGFDGAAATVALERPDLAWHWPLLLPAGTLGVLLAAWFVAGLVRDVPIKRVAVPIALTVAASAALVPAFYGVPLAVAVGVLLAGAAVLVGLGVAVHGELRVVALVLATPVAGLALMASFQSDVLTAVTTGLLGLAAVALSLSASAVLRTVGDVLFVPAAAVCAWTVLDLGGSAPEWRSLAVLLIAGAWAILGARIEREVPAAATALVGVALGLGATGSIDQTWLAIDLTVAGVLTHVSALANTHRRFLGWAGLGFMVLAQWVRMADVGVETPEAYTLPLASVLVAVGVIGMLRTPSLRSTRALVPGLLLALVPSLLLSLSDPVSLRALLLGLGCLAAVVAGVGLRWSAPLVVGASVGLALVLREASYANDLPQWVIIGGIGLVLTAVGITWESRLRDVRRASAYLRRLR